MTEKELIKFLKWLDEVKCWDTGTHEEQVEIAKEYFKSISATEIKS